MSHPLWLRMILLSAVALGGMGCGRAEDQRQVDAVTERFLLAIERDDGVRACAQLTDGAVDALEQEAGQPCAAAVRETPIPPGRVATAAVFGTSAKVDLSNGQSAFLERTPRGWRLSAAGCLPEPDDQPYTCEVEA